MYQNIATKVLTGTCRLSYEHLLQPYANQPGAEPKYSVTLLIPKSDVATKTEIDASIQAAVQKGIADKWGGVQPPNVKIPLYDGDGVRPGGEPFGPECKGCWVMTASARQQNKPEVVDTNIQPILSPSEIYSGMYARVAINFFPYNSNGNRGIGCGLGNVQKIADGEPLGGRSSAADDFGAAPAPEHIAGAAQAAMQSVVAAHAQPAAYSTPTAQPAAPQAQPPFAAPFAAQPQQQVNPFTGQPQTGGVMGI